MEESKQPIHDAATVILLRKRGKQNLVLMGQRSEAAVFMPSKFVFPGGRVDVGDGAIDLTHQLARGCRVALAHDSDPQIIPALLIAAIRELWEETGLRLGGKAAQIPPLKSLDFYPSAKGLRFFFRAITPPQCSRRFDARFFLAPADKIDGDIDDFSYASDELSDLQWVSIRQALAMDIPVITRAVLFELENQLAGTQAAGIAYYPFDARCNNDVSTRILPPSPE